MSPISLLIAGLPGKMASEVAAAAAGSDDMHLCGFALVAEEHEGAFVDASGAKLRAVRPSERGSLEIPAGTIAVDFTWPESALGNVEFYVSRGIPFVMGTTGFDMDRARALVASSGVPAVIAPNMAVPIVLLQTAIAEVAERFPGSLGGYEVSVRESHQAGKKDTSGTAKALVRDFSRLGLPASADRIEMVRDPRVQHDELGVPREFLPGHAYHFYEISSADGHARIGLSHCIEGRRVYAEGALQAARFLASRGAKGVVHSMTDVLAADTKRK